MKPQVSCSSSPRMLVLLSVHALLHCGREHRQVRKKAVGVHAEVGVRAQAANASLNQIMSSSQKTDADRQVQHSGKLCLFHGRGPKALRGSGTDL